MGFARAPDTPVYEDDAACIEWGSHVIGGRERAKHIDIRKHFAHETIQSRQMRLIRWIRQASLTTYSPSHSKCSSFSPAATGY